MPRHREDCESSSEGSEHELDWDSDTSATSSCSSEAASIPEVEQDTHGSPISGTVCEPGSKTADQVGLEETRAAEQEKTKEEMENRDLESMKSFFMSSPSPVLLRRPPSVVSTLHLQALPSNHGDVIVYTQVGYSCPE